MSLSGSLIKRKSKDILKQNSVNFAITAIIVMAVWFIISNFSAVIEIFTTTNGYKAVFALFSVLIFFPVLMGFLRYSWRAISGVVDNPILIFYYFSEKRLYFKVLKFAYSIAWRIIICYFIFYIPVFVLKIITGTLIYEILDTPIPMWTFNLTNIEIFLKILAATATVFSVIKYYMAPMLFVADENMDIAEAIHLSTVLAKRTTIDFISLVFGFTGWILLSFLSVPIIFTLPYMTIAYLIHAYTAVNAFNQLISNTKYDDIPTFIAGA